MPPTTYVLPYYFFEQPHGVNEGVLRVRVEHTISRYKSRHVPRQSLSASFIFAGV
jgi:hypothetical protein